MSMFKILFFYQKSRFTFNSVYHSWQSR